MLAHFARQLYKEKKLFWLIGGSDQYARMAVAEVETLPFTKGRKQLEKVGINSSQALSLVRILVERVIRLKYTILQGTVPTSLIPDRRDTESTIDKMIMPRQSLRN